MQDIDTLNQLLDDWFGPVAERNQPDKNHQKLWFSPSAEQDANLRKDWAWLHLKAIRNELTHWCYTPRSRLGLILLLDQLPRVLYRSTPQAFDWDGQALALCLTGMDAGQDQELMLSERAFFYMPLQHSEDVAAQRISTRQTESLQDAFPDHRESASSYLKFAKLHRDIIEQFGRFPHRNKILNRQSTEPEIEWLNSDNSHSFGQ